MLLYSLLSTDVINLSLSLDAKMVASDCSSVELSWNHSNHSLWGITIEEYVLKYWMTNRKRESKSVTLANNMTSYSLSASLLKPDTNYTFSLNATARCTAEGASYEVASGATVITVLTRSCPGEVPNSPPVACQGCMDILACAVVYLTN